MGPPTGEDEMEISVREGYMDNGVNINDRMCERVLYNKYKRVYRTDLNKLTIWIHGLVY